MTEPNDWSDEQLAAMLLMPPGTEQRMKAELQLSLRNLKGQAEVTKAQREAIEVQRKVAEAEAKAADASIIGAKAAERNAKWMLASVIVAAISAFFSAVATGLSLWSAMQPK